MVTHPLLYPFTLSVGSPTHLSTCPPGRLDNHPPILLDRQSPTLLAEWSLTHLITHSPCQPKGHPPTSPPIHPVCWMVTLPPSWPDHYPPINLATCPVSQTINHPLHTHIISWTIIYPILYPPTMLAGSLSTDPFTHSPCWPDCHPLIFYLLTLSASQPSAHLSLHSPC